MLRVAMVSNARACKQSACTAPAGRCPRLLRSPAVPDARWCQDYRQAGRDRLTDQRNGGNRALLGVAQHATIQQKLHQYTPYDVFGPAHQSGGAGAYWSVPDLRRAVARWTGVRYQDAQSYRDLFKRCGFSYQRTERQYRSRKEADVLAFGEQVEKN